MYSLLSRQEINSSSCNPSVHYLIQNNPPGLPT